jgi:hypothetical protein
LGEVTWDASGSIQIDGRKSVLKRQLSKDERTITISILKSRKAQICLTRDRDHWGLFNTAMNFRVPYEVCSFLTS